MKKAKDLVEFMNWELGHTPLEEGERREMINEIMARLQEYEELRVDLKKALAKIITGN